MRRTHIVEAKSVEDARWKRVARRGHRDGRERRSAPDGRKTRSQGRECARRVARDGTASARPGDRLRTVAGDGWNRRSAVDGRAVRRPAYRLSAPDGGWRTGSVARLRRQCRVRGDRAFTRPLLEIDCESVRERFESGSEKLTVDAVVLRAECYDPPLDPRFCISGGHEPQESGRQPITHRRRLGRIRRTRQTSGRVRAS